MPSLNPRKPLQALLEQRRQPLRYLLAVLACVAVAALTTPLRHRLDLANTVMLYLLTVFVVALRLGRGPAVVSALLGVAAFDYYIVPPHLSFVPTDPQHLITLTVMLTVALVTGEQTGRLRQQAEGSALRERQSQDLYVLARKLAGASSRPQVTEALCAHLGEHGLQASLWLPRPDAPPPPVPPGLSPELLHTLMERNESREIVLGGRPQLLMPLSTPLRRQGMLLISLPGGSQAQGQLAQQRNLLLTLASLAAIALERLEYADVVQETQLDMASERLRNSVLSALSHDLRTPLTVMMGLAETLVLSPEPMSDKARADARSLCDQARALSGMLTNLLDMARLKSGRMQLRKDWHLVDDLLAAALRLLRPTLAGRPTRVRLAPELSLVEFDAVLMERVICNLVENAARYSPPGSPIELRAQPEGRWVRIEVCDQGPGFPRKGREALFDPFVRGRTESTTTGAGLGLAICHSIVAAHGGSLHIEDRPEGGACVALRLPLGTPPEISDDDPLDDKAPQA